VHPKAESALPRQSKSPIFKEIGEIWTDNLVVLACLLRATTRKGQLFQGRKVHPRENPGYAYV